MILIYSVGHFTSVFGFLTIGCVATAPLFGFMNDYFRDKFGGMLLELGCLP